MVSEGPDQGLALIDPCRQDFAISATLNRSLCTAASNAVPGSSLSSFISPLLSNIPLDKRRDQGGDTEEPVISGPLPWPHGPTVPGTAKRLLPTALTGRQPRTPRFLSLRRGAGSPQSPVARQPR